MVVMAALNNKWRKIQPVTVNYQISTYFVAEKRAKGVEMNW
jgi:hypothetical protein